MYIVVRRYKNIWFVSEPILRNCKLYVDLQYLRLCWTSWELFYSHLRLVEINAVLLSWRYSSTALTLEYLWTPRHQYPADPELSFLRVDEIWLVCFCLWIKKELRRLGIRVFDYFPTRSTLIAKQKKTKIINTVGRATCSTDPYMRVRTYPDWIITACHTTFHRLIFCHTKSLYQGI